MLLSLPWLLHLSTFVFVPDSGRGSIGVQAIGCTLDESSHGENLMNSFQAAAAAISIIDIMAGTIPTVSEAFGDSWIFMVIPVVPHPIIQLVDVG